MRPLVANEDGSYISYPTVEAEGRVTGLALKFAESFVFSESEDDKEDKEEDKTKQANLDTGDVHVDGIKKSKDIPGGKKMTDEEKKAEDAAKAAEATKASEAAKVVNDATKTYVEGQTKQLTEKLDEQTALRQAAESRLATLEVEAQTRRFTDVIMGRDGAGDGSPPFAGKHETHNSILSLLAKEHGETSEQFKEYISEQRAISKQMREAGMFKEIGNSAPGSIAGDVAARNFNDAVTKWMGENAGKTKAEAITAVAAATPKLYTEKVKEEQRRAMSATGGYGYEEEEK